MEEIQKADPRARRRARVLVAAGTVFGLIFFPLAGSYVPALARWVSRDPESRLRLARGALAIAFAVPTVGFAAYFWRLGDSIVRAERFPAPGTAVVRDTVVLRGDRARRRGRSAQVVAGLLALLSAGFLLFLWRLLALLDRNAA